MKKWQLFSAFVLFALIPQAAYAHCPLCTAATGGAVATARFYGLDDTIVGVWIGAFIISTALWFDRMIKKEYVQFQRAIIILLSFALTVVPFYLAGIMSAQASTIFGVDKLFFGMLVGSVVSYFAFSVSWKIKAERKKRLFPFQTMAIALLLLALTSVIFWVMVK